MKIVDCRGLTCPKPVILTKKEVESPDFNEIEVIVDNESSRENVKKYLSSANLLFTMEEKEGLYHFYARKQGDVKKVDDAVVCDISNISIETGLTYVIASDKFGNGDDSLGALLMKSFIYSLTEATQKPGTLIFLNAGVKLTSEGSDVLESLKKLEEFGVEILSCGTCLDFYNLKENLKVGSVTNMYTIVEKMNSTKTIKI
ncbi:SirA-like protein [Caloramator mitchellensis]|uniref:SirA-like protein n=1 Tax=Caloramator mitchellensis TaxID=908809 RepID=A0A0R3JRA1_CALMK|nr:sulfurtransferase-like selenium metabolism protein YedF [Caloramator mitchellensis]KRQ85960.1 SirA-like protein [Caloramator mitchellensis]